MIVKYRILVISRRIVTKGCSSDMVNDDGSSYSNSSDSRIRHCEILERPLTIRLEGKRVHKIVCKGETDMVKRRSNQLTNHELNKVFNTENYSLFEEALEIFLKNCSVRNLREHTINITEVN